ncbi:hypothetical protein NE865_08701 [Phthorimaea operculella]|nr:hypothetical protein NE865_08701 [Phthorimaea operculella]
MNHLPAHVRSVLVVSDNISRSTALDDLALIADKMMEQQQQYSQVSSVSSPSESCPAKPSETQALVDEIRKLSLEVAELKRQHRPRSHSRYREKSPHPYRPRSRSREYTYRRPHTDGVCYYHSKFKQHARRCNAPCTYKKNTYENQQPEN